MKQLAKTAHPLVIRTDFENEQAWKAVCELIRAPVRDGDDEFYAYVEFLEESDYRNLTKEELLAIVPRDYDHSFLFVVDRATIADPLPVLARNGRDANNGALQAWTVTRTTRPLHAFGLKSRSGPRRRGDR